MPLNILLTHAIYRIMREAKVHIESLAFKGYGVARIYGKVVFIPYSVSGDEGVIELIEERKRYSIGRWTHIFKPSPWRNNPLCPHFGRCGGCQWQHIRDSIQIDFKKEILMDLLRRLGKLKDLPLIISSPPSQFYGYRTRIQLKVSGKSIGYFRERSHQVVDIHECPIAHPLINQMLYSIREKFPSMSQTKQVEINLSPEEGKGILLLHLSSPNLIIERGWEAFFKSHPIFKGLAIEAQKGRICLGDPYLNFTISLNGEGAKRRLKYRASLGSFSQINMEENQKLIETVLQFSELNGEASVLDLYAGIGNFTLPLAMKVKEVIGVEENQKAVEDAYFNRERNGIKNCDFIQGRVEEVLRDWKRERIDLIVLDPPRAGCKWILEQMVRLKPKKIIYVSCEPTTFSRDIAILSEKGYPLKKIRLIDMFPQTYHMEIIGLLQLN